MKPSLLQWEPAAIERRLEELGGRAFQARVARAELLGRGKLDYEGMSALPKDLRRTLATEVPLLSSIEKLRTWSSDGACKLLLEFPAQSQSPGARTVPAQVETVFIPPHERGSTKGATVCVSTQVGCPVACPFCASGKAGLQRNLAAHEIAEQFAHARALGPISRAVVMGIGEPLLNLDNLLAGLSLVRSELDLGARKVTVSSVGFPERVRRAAQNDPRFQLAISLHTPDQEQRDFLVPAMRGVPIEDVLAAGDEWFHATGREVTYEYVLLAGTNDSEGHALRLAERLRGRRATVNLIPYNPIEESTFGRPTPESVARFAGCLERAKLVATVRWSRGVDGQAACGQLRVSNASGAPPA